MSEEDPVEARARGARLGALAAILVGAIAAIGSVVAGALSEDVERCRIATEFLIDDKKDPIVIDEDDARRLGLLYIGMTERFCRSD